MKIVIVDDYPIARQGILAILSLEPDLEIVGQAGCIHGALKVILEATPHLVLVDLKLRQESGFDLIRRARESGSESQFVVLTSSADMEDFRRANEAGVNGYILKEALPEEIIAAIRSVQRGRKYYDPVMVELFMKGEVTDPVEELTKRELEVLVTLGEGLNNRDIAKRLYITEYTVKKHVSQILAKLELKGRTQAALYASTRAIAL